MHLFTCNHWLTRPLDGLHIYLALVIVSFLGVGWQGGFSSHKFTPDFCSNWHMPSIGGFIFKRCVIQQLGLSEKPQGICSMFDSSTSTYLILTFLEEAPKLSAKFIVFSAQYILEVLSWSYQNSHLMLLGLTDPLTVLSLRRSHGILFHFFPCAKEL